MKKIYDLLLSCKEDNFKLAYELSKTVEDFNLKNISNYFISKNDIKYISQNHNKVYKFYKSLRDSFKEFSIDCCESKEAIKYYNDKLKHLHITVLSVNRNRKSKVVTLNCKLQNNERVKLIYGSAHILSEKRTEYKRIEYVTCANVHDIFDVTDNIKKSVMLKYINEQLKGTSIVNDYINLKIQEYSKNSEYSKFCKEICDILHAYTINKLIKYNRVLDVLNNNELPIVFNNGCESVEIISYDKKEQKVDYKFIDSDDDQNVYKNYTTLDLFTLHLMRML